MRLPSRKRALMIGGGVLLLAILVYGFLPKPVPVEQATVTRGPLQVAVEEEGVTRIENSFLISSPATAYMRRIDLEVGDVIARGQALVQLEPPRAAILDPRTRAEAQARVDAAAAGVVQAQNQARAAQAVATQAQEERDRAKRLFDAGSVTRQAYDRAVAEASQADASLDAARAAVNTAQAQLAAARAGLRQAASSGLSVNETLRSPVAGRVLALRRESEGMVAAGEPLVEVGTTGDLQVRVEVLSQDAVRMRPGTRVEIQEWGGPEALQAVVSRIEPVGYTKVSSLGVEEQRVGVVADLTTPEGRRTGLGAGYRVLARFVLWEGKGILQVPTSALFRSGDEWAVFVVENNRAVRRPVRIGQQSGVAAQILSGLKAGETVIVHPSNAVSDDTRVRQR